MNALTKALDRSRALATSAHEVALNQKQAMEVQLANDGNLGGITNWGVQRSNREKYGLFRGWLYSAIHALASEAAGQQVNVAQVIGEIQEDERAASIRREKQSYYRRKMQGRMRTKMAESEFEILYTHPLSKLLEQPNPMQSQWQFVYSFVANLSLTGWAFIIGGETGEGTEFYSLPTTWVTPIHKDGPFSEFEIKNPNNPQQKGTILTRDNVAFAHLPNPADPLSALAPAQSQINAIRIDDHIQTSQEAFFENGIFPSVVVTVGKDPHPEVSGGMRPRLTAAQRRQVVTAIRKVMSGVANYGNPAIVDGMIESIERLSATQNEMGWEKSETATRTRILSAFGVHPYILGEPVNVGGYAQAAKIEERFCKRVNTYLEMLSTLITNFSGKHFNDQRLVVWWEPAAPHDPSLHWQNVRFAREKGDITENEFRAELGFPPNEEAKEVTSKLLETVGGMTGSVQILSAMGQGVIQPEAAATLLSLFLGIPIEEARGIAAGATTAPQQPAALPSPPPPDEEDEDMETLGEAIRLLKIEPKLLAERILEASK